jgi:hypothetical protein
MFILHIADVGKSLYYVVLSKHLIIRFIIFLVKQMCFTKVKEKNGSLYYHYKFCLFSLLYI